MDFKIGDVTPEKKELLSLITDKIQNVLKHFSEEISFNISVNLFITAMIRARDTSGKDQWDNLLPHLKLFYDEIWDDLQKKSEDK